jgi:hypothetical protein
MAGRPELSLDREPELLELNRNVIQKALHED